MRSLRSRPVPGDRVATGLVTLVAAVAVTGCGALGTTEPGESGPPRLTPDPQPDVAAAMIESISEPDDLLNACELLNLTTGEIMDLTGADMPEVDPTGSGDLGMVCTYGGPGSPERLEAELSAAAEAEAEAGGTVTTDPDGVDGTEDPEGAGDADGADGADGAGDDDDDNTDTADADGDADTGPGSDAGPDAGPDATEPGTVATMPEAPVFDPDVVPDTFAAAVIKPRVGSAEALAQQSTLLGVRYACSEIRGGDASSVRAAPGAPEAPAAVSPELSTAYIDCAAAPTGGGLEVRTILVADSDLWHLALISPGTPRSPETEAAALEGLHRVATEILG